MNGTLSEALGLGESPFATSGEDVARQPLLPWLTQTELTDTELTGTEQADVGEPALTGTPAEAADASAELADAAAEVADTPAGFEDELLDELVSTALSVPPGDSATAGEVPALEHFTGPEHRDIGDAASGGEITTLAYGSAGARLSFGEVVAMAGDWFGTYEEMAELSRTASGRARLAWARWAALDRPKNLPEPPVPDAVKTAVRQRYYALASQNLAHFSGGGSAWQAYVSGHAKALVDALDAGEHEDAATWRRALTKEAFAQHFLTDMLAAGHIRTPRAAIRDWYGQHHPDSAERFVRYLARFLFDRLNEHQQLPPLAWWFPWVTRSIIEGDIRTLGGEAMRTFSLGDIVGLALHNMDNRGLRVVSDLDHNGHRVPDGHHWIAVGDTHFGTAADRPAATRHMVRAAARASLAELRAVRDAGRALHGSAGPDRAAAIKQVIGPMFAAHGYVPREDRTPGANTPLPGAGVTQSPLEWRWGQLGEVAAKEVDVTVRGQLADELFARLPDIPDPVVVSDTTLVDLRVRGTRAAFRAFVDHLRNEGIRALELAVGSPARR